MKNKRLLSVFMALVIVVTSCCVGLFANAQDKHIDINKEMLDSILNERYWIIETLVDGDISNNPYAIINPSSPNQNMMQEVLENYQNNEAFKALVNAMEVYSNSGQYLNGFADDILSVFESWFGNSDTADKIIASTDELKYESILNEILQTDYESSWGDTLFEENMDMENLKQRADILGKLNSYQTTLKDFVGLNNSDSSSIIIYDPYNMESDTFEIDIEDYVGHFLDAYGQDLEVYLNNIVDIPSLGGNESLKKKIISTGALGLVTAYERTVIPETHFDLDEIYYDGMFEDTMKILNGAGKTLEIADKTMDYAILLEALQSQKNTTVQTMTRVSNNTDDADLAKVCDNYADLVNSAGDEKTLAYETITNYLRNEQTVTNIVQKAAKEQAPKLINTAAEKFAGAKTVVLSNAIAKAIAVVDLSVWVADQATGIEETAKKIYICKYLDKIINEVIHTFNIDLENYNSSRTDENAEKVLADLQFLKELRLYGEKSAYGSMSAQMESWIGLLLGGGETKEYLDRRYQASVDTYLGCSFTPVTNNEFILSKNDVLNILSEDVDGKTYTYAEVKTADGDTVYFAEADLRLLGGIDLNGATVNILDAPNGIYLPLMENDTDGSVINIYCDNVAFGTISNSADLTIEIQRENITFEVTDSIDNSDTLNIVNSKSSSNISVYNITNSENINITNCVLKCKGISENNGTITGMVDICGDGTSAYENAYYKIENQSMQGTGTYTNLYFNNSAKEGIGISGTQTVTGSISNASSRLRASDNIVLTGSCSVVNNYFHSSLCFKDYTSSASLTVNGTGYIKNNVTFGAATIFEDGLHVTSSCGTLTLNGETNVKGDMLYDGGTITGSEWLKLHGDLTVTASSPAIANLDFVGRLPQNVSSSSDITVLTLDNHNTSLSGVNFESKINVTDSLNSGSTSAYENGKNIVLTETAKLNGGSIKGNISAKDWVCSDTAEIKGTLYASGTVTVSNGVQLTVTNYDQSSGTLTVDENGSLNCINEFRQAGATVNNGTVFIGGDSNITDDFTGGTVQAKGDMSLSCAFTPDDLIFDSKVGQTFSNSSTTEVNHLTVTNTSKSGFTVGSVISVNNAFYNNCNNLINGENIVLTNDSGYIADGETKGDFSVSGSFTVKSGETLTVNGKLILKSGADLTVEDGATLVVKRHIDSSSAAINVQEGGSLQINDYLDSSSDTFNIGGELLVKSDAKISGSTVNATGLIIFKGDLNSSSCTWNNPNLSFSGKVPQTVSGSSINANDLIVENRSKTGITFSSKVNYYGAYTNASQTVTGESNLVSQS